ncbi:hypothetical protein HUJ04_011893 [Dendroctonus ponderosae]|uniref:G-protein coupled receptors family 2 profile 2 domain-containing protein n=1 Tax=Dendroctonus ponderosae TaxID=77166 RepID=A0AAR5P5K9_DENPD|nr:hypothetical protein HUJ04_011893 [Dendroctonus ponderosae]
MRVGAWQTVPEFQTVKMQWIAFARKVFIGFVFLILTRFNENTALPNNGTLDYCLTGYDESKACSIRGNLLAQPIWNHYAGYLCYNYTNSARFSQKFNATFKYVNCSGTIYHRPVPAAVVDNTTIALFDYKHEESAALLRKSFKTDELFDNFVKCCEEAEDCCTNAMNNENIVSTADFCPVVWDAWSCFPQTAVNTIQSLPCSSQAYQSPDKVCTLESEKSCQFNETIQLAEWNQQTDYSNCAIASIYLARYNYHVSALYVCIVCSLPAILIFLAIPVFRDNSRVILHRNLLISIVIRNVLTIMAKKIVIIDALLSPTASNQVMDNNPVGCRLLSFFVSAATNSTYACMMVDGYYLHKVIVRTFAKEPPLVFLYSLVAVLTFLPSIIWASIVAANERTSCWMVDTNGEQWSVDSFRMVILFINTVLLLDIVRVMISKMKQGGTTRQTKAAFRATLFLIPLFGLHIFITAKKIVINDTCWAEDIYDYFRYTMEASQGIFVAILFCYANAEVHNELNNLFRKLSIQLNQRLGWNFARTAARRRTTTATYVQPADFKNEF